MCLKEARKRCARADQNDVLKGGQGNGVLRADQEVTF